jgi:hypothetical protein
LIIALARAVFDVPGICEGFHHGSHGSRDYGERFGKRAHRNELLAALGEQQHVLQVIFNGARGHCWFVTNKLFEATKLLF